MVVNINIEGATGLESLTATLDEAMSLTGFGVYNMVHMLLSGVILMGVITQSVSMGYVIPAAQCDLDLSLQQRGWITALPFIAIILTSYFWGYLADTRGRRFIMLITMIVSTIFSVLASFSPEIISFSLLIFLASAFLSAPSAIVYTYIGEFSIGRHRDKMVTFGTTFAGIGTVLLPALAWLILPLDFARPMPFLDIFYRPWRLLIVTCNLPFIIGTIFLIFAPESPKFLHSTGRSDECLDVLKKIYSVNKKMPVDTFPVKTLILDLGDTKTNHSKGLATVLSSMKDQTFPLFKMPLLPWTFVTCFVQFGIFAVSNGFFVWFPTILNYLMNHDGAETKICDVLNVALVSDDAVECADTLNTEIFEISIYVGLALCAMYIVVGFFLDIMTKKIIIVASLFSTGLCGIIAHNINNQIVAVVLFGIFQICGVGIGLVNAIAVDLFPTKFRAMAVCLAMMTGRVGSVTGTNLIGLFLTTNCGASFYLFGSIIIVCSLLCVALPKHGPVAMKSTPLDVSRNEIHIPK